MKQKINITDSKDVTIIQAGGNVYYQSGKVMKKPSQKKIKELTEKYCKFIIDYNEYKNIRCLDPNISLTMDNYIPLQLGEKIEKIKEKSQKIRKDEELRETKDIDFRVWREEHFIGETHSLTPVDVWRAIQNKKIVVKGDPGSGKTTLIKYIAYSLCKKKSSKKKTIPADLIPLVIDLKDWAEKGAIPLSEYYTRYVLVNTGLENKIEPLIKYWLKIGKAIILCDGLDEIRKDKKSIIQSLQNLASGEYRNCHILVTTRIVGYVNDLVGWKHYEVMPLKRENIEQYARDYLKNKSPEFLSALKNTPQIEPLSKNPLLLQILCFVFDKQKLVLPTNRIELYKKAVFEMLKLRDPKIPPSIKENVLQRIAYHFLEGKEVFEEDEVREIIKNYLEEKKEKYNVDDVLKEIEEKSGLLYKVSDNRYIFLHLTFEEYFCACYLAKSKEDLCQIFKPILFNPKFCEVVRLVAGMLSKEEAHRFIDFILNQKPFLYDTLHQPLLLAGLCIADIPDDKEEPLKEKRVVNELLQLWKETKVSSLRDEINRVFVSMAGTRNGEKIVNTFLGLLENKDEWVRKNAAIALGNLGYADDKVIDGLLKLLEDKNEWVRKNAAIALGRLGRADDKVIDGLLELLKSEDFGMRYASAEALGMSGRTDDKVIDGLLELLKDKNPVVRKSLAIAFGNLGYAVDKVIDGLLELLKDEMRDENWDVCYYLAEALGRLGRADDKVIDVLLGLLKDKDERLRYYSAIAFGNLGYAVDKVIDGLLGLLKDEDKWVCYASAKALGNLGYTDNKVINGLVELLKDKISYVRKISAIALGRLGYVNDKVIDILLGLLKDEDWYDASAEALGMSGRTDNKVINGLVELLKDKISYVREASVTALGNLGYADDKVIDGLLKLLEDKSSYVRKALAKALGNLGYTDNKVIDGLIVLLKDKDSNVRNTAFVSLKKLAEKQAKETSVRLTSPPFEKFELTPAGFKLFVEKNRIRAETLISNMDFSQRITLEAKSDLPKILNKFEGISIVLCGSFCRLEASESSDADFFTVLENRSLKDKAIEAMLITAEWFNKKGINIHLEGLKEKLQKDYDEGFGKGKFPTFFPKDKLLESLGSPDDSDEWRTRRMCVLTESIPLHNFRFFNEIKENLSRKYFLHLASATNRLPEVFLKDFKMWCLSLDIAPWIRKEVTELFRIKAEILRKFTHNATLLAFATILIQKTENAFKTQLSILEYPPILRLFYAINFLPSDLWRETATFIINIIESYNDSLKILSDKELRRYVKNGLPKKDASFIKNNLDENGTKIKTSFQNLWNKFPREKFELFFL